MNGGVMVMITKDKFSPPGGHVFLQTRTIFKHIQDIIRTNGLTKFHDDWTINVIFRVKNAPHSGSHVFSRNWNHFELLQDIIGKNLLNKFHEDQTINVASRVLQNATTPFHNDRKISVFSTVNKKYASRLVAPGGPWWHMNVASRENAPPPDGHVFQPTRTIFKLIQDIIRTNLLTKFHEDKWGI
ncbi:hypothetical protein DPMN_016299 [Dreissena polymorpha]|uniref:Uncharacterized protein n=1 Tax=Dreissena polymorpha TaxID=45954 RepID=A0A9D4S5D0_DREPO|nr:hypothetical protein DPMN_016299 [Dreissena polymorpha]